MLKPLSSAHRQQSLKNLDGGHYDVLVIGGGITGAGVARDAASRGLKVALVEARDFAEGTSSRSSKLIHGGIRYLENLEFALVFEALRERSTLFEIAPHLVHPLRFVIPVYKTGRVPFWKLGVGMWLYDLLALFDAPELHHQLNQVEILEKLPFLQSKDLVGGFEYSDAYMDDDRLVLETLRSAHSLGADIANFVKAVGITKQGENISLVHLQDERTDKKLSVRASQIVCCAGPWTDVLGQDFFKDWRRNLRPTKGVHLIFSRQRFPLHDAVVMAAEERIVFGIPRNDIVILGTTDTDFSADPASVNTLADDVKYLLAVANAYFPGLALTKTDILGNYAGVRPLVDDGANTESKTSREHKIARRGNFLYVTGGKYTTYRNMARQAVDDVVAQWPWRERVRFRPSDTARSINPDATAEKTRELVARGAEICANFDLTAEEFGHLVARFSGEVPNLLQNGKDYLPERPGPRLWMLEAFHAIENTMCLNLVDFYVRRTPLFLTRSDSGFEVMEPIVRVFRQHYGWDDSETEMQINALREYARHERAWQTQLE